MQGIVLFAMMLFSLEAACADYKECMGEENSLFGCGKYQEAIEAFELASKYKPKEAEAYYNKGFSLERLGKYQEAIDAYNLAIKYESDYVNAYYNKGLILGKLGKYQEAIDAFDLALKYDPHDIEAQRMKNAALKGLETNKKR